MHTYAAFIIHVNDKEVSKLDIRAFNGKIPRIHPDAYVDPKAIIMGDVARAVLLFRGSWKNG